MTIASNGTVSVRCGRVGHLKLSSTRASSPTDLSVCLSSVYHSESAVWHSWCMTISIGLTCLSASSTKSSSWLLDSSLSHWYRAMVSSCRLCSGLRDGIETSSTLRRWSSARRTVWTHVAFGRSLYSVRDYGTLCLYCCVTVATTLLALDILWRHSFSQSTSAYSALGALATVRFTNLRFTYLVSVACCVVMTSSWCGTWSVVSSSLVSVCLSVCLSQWVCGWCL